MAKKRTKIIIFVVLLFILISASIGLFMFYQPVKDYANAGADIKMNVSKLISEFQNNEAEANKKYVSSNDVIQVNGILKEIINNPDGSISLTLVEKSDDSDKISATLEKSFNSKAKELQIGAKITIKGQCTGYQELIDKEVIMIRAGIVE